MRRFLLIAYYFAPSGSTAAHRPVKWCRYLGRWGWRPVVVTATPETAPGQDASLAAELPPGLEVVRLPSPLERMAAGGDRTGEGTAGRAGSLTRLKGLATGLLFPDPQVVWLPWALPGALAAARNSRAEAVVVTAPPFSSFLLGRAVASCLGLPLILDFRDEWSGFYAQGFAPGEQSRLWAWLVERLESSLVGAAARVTTASPDYCRRFRECYGGPEGKYVWLPNGYDPDDFAGVTPVAPALGRLRLAYAGTIFPVTSLAPLWQGMARLEPGERARIAVEVMGRAAPGEVVDPGLAGLTIRERGKVDHAAAVAAMAGSDGLILTLSDLPGAERVLPSKVFEYLAARRPILAVVPPGRAGGIVRACAGGEVVHPGDPGAIAAALRSWLADPPATPPPPPAVFSRPAQARLLAGLLDEVAP